MSKRDDLIKELEASALWFDEDGEGWSVMIDGIFMRVDMHDDRLVRVTGCTGVKFDEDKAPELLAAMDHIAGWKFKVGEFGILPDGEMGIYLDREIGSNDPLDRMLARMASSAKESADIFQKVKRGVPLDAAVSKREEALASLLFDDLD